MRRDSDRLKLGAVRVVPKTKGVRAFAFWREVWKLKMSWQKGPLASKSVSHAVLVRRTRSLAAHDTQEVLKELERRLKPSEESGTPI